MRTLRAVALVVAAGLATPAGAAIWPDQLGGAAKTATKALTVKDKALWSEYGLEHSEQAEYALGEKKFTATGYRLHDPTGALAAFLWQRPADAKPSQLASAAVETSDGVMLVYYNYLLQFAGWKPAVADLEPFLRELRPVNAAEFPRSYLPAGGLAPNSTRYILGPLALDRFVPRIPPSVAAFHLGCEVEAGSYTTKAGDFSLAVFSYPTPQIASMQLEAFRKLPGVMAKRSGPLVAAAIAPPDADAAERLLAEVRYQAVITEAERMPTPRDNVGNLLLNVFILAGILMALFIAAGLVFGFLRAWSRRGKVEDPVIVLHLDDRR
ncbi:MAG: DUF6599 family protein [Rhodospirillales bacterium]